MSHGFGPVLPEKILRLLSPADRASLGKGGMSAEDVLQRGRVKAERDLQNLIDNYLRMRGVVAIRSRMDAPTSNNKGCPDFLFCVNVRNASDDFGGRLHPVACAWEVKLPCEKMTKDQTDMAAKLSDEVIGGPNAWRWALITSVDDALAELAAIGFISHVDVSPR
jgi:hypothetical protein